MAGTCIHILQPKSHRAKTRGKLRDGVALRVALPQEAWEGGAQRLVTNAQVLVCSKMKMFVKKTVRRRNS